VDELANVYDELLKSLALTDNNLFFSKIFVTDLINQNEITENHPLFARLNNGACSVIEQPPLDGSKINILLWLIRIDGMKTRKVGHSTIIEMDGTTHIFHPAGFATQQFERTTNQAFEEHDSLLRQYDMTVPDNCVRTWLFVKDIDKDYLPVVSGRNTFFRNNGLNKDTHFIASTGIGGCSSSEDSSLRFDFYSVKGIRDEQKKYLKALDFMSSTSDYGVSFERGTSIRYKDIRHIFISGTASIDEHGKATNLGNVVRQLDRIFVNIEQLLIEADATPENIMQMIVYLRDVSDYSIVNKYISERFGHVPAVILLARVCRPAWLVEVECVAQAEA
jgi:enamine deaminase RidA (YjgF/YER057c/UK114 family)